MIAVGAGRFEAAINRHTLATRAVERHGLRAGPELLAACEALEPSGEILFRYCRPSELSARPWPTLLPGAIHMGDLIVAYGDKAFALAFKRILGDRVFLLHAKASGRPKEWAEEYDLLDAARGPSRDLRCALVYFDDGASPRKSDWFRCEASVVIEATGPLDGRLVKLRDFEDCDKAVRIEDDLVFVISQL